MHEYIGDKILMLLSTDWFFPYWSSIGIEIKKESAFQAACRTSVKDLMGGASEYWLIDRWVNRGDAVKTLLVKCGAFPQTIERLNLVLAEKGPSGFDQRDQWTIWGVLDGLANGRAPQLPSLDPDLREVICSLWKQHQTLSFEDLYGLAHLAMCSPTPWDIYIRSLTPDLPSLLSDFLSLSVQRIEFESFWAAAMSQLTASQKEELLNWFPIAVPIFTNGEVQWPSREDEDDWE